MRSQIPPQLIYDVERSPSFSLGTALMLLGHDCPGRCPSMLTDERAAVFFMHLPDRSIATWTKTLVDVDFNHSSRPDVERHDLLSQVNRCVWADNLRVRERTSRERAAFFAALAERRGQPARDRTATAAPLEHLAAVTPTRRDETTRHMVSGAVGHGFTVSEHGIALATDLSFDVAHELVHQGCLLCAANEDHLTPSFV